MPYMAIIPNPWAGCPSVCCTVMYVWQQGCQFHQYMNVHLHVTLLSWSLLEGGIGHGEAEYIRISNEVKVHKQSLILIPNMVGFLNFLRSKSWCRNL